MFQRNYGLQVHFHLMGVDPSLNDVEKQFRESFVSLSSVPPADGKVDSVDIAASQLSEAF